MNTGTPRCDAVDYPPGRYEISKLARTLEREVAQQAETIARLREALESAAATIQQFVDINRIPANNKGLRDARAALVQP